MGKLKGDKELKAFMSGEELTTKEAIKAHCFQCNGETDGSGNDCQGKNCPLYPFFVKWVMRA